MSDDIDRIIDGLSEAQREWIMHGPYPLWTQTRRALAKKGIKSLVGMRGMNDLGNRVRARLLERDKSA